MAEGGLPNLPIWSRFFAQAREGVDYEAWLHCQDLPLCRESLPDTNGTFRIINTVESHWCTDLVSPMNALLTAALGVGRGNRHDKFVFVSDTTVPVKPFSYVQHKLIVQDAEQSSFCVQEWPKWAWFKTKRVLAKHSQWLVLSRAHAEKAVRAQDTLKPSRLMRQMTPLTWAGSERIAPFVWQMRESALRLTHNPLVDMAFGLVVPAVRGCADEFWHLAVVTGALDPGEAEQGLEYKSLAGGTISMRPGAEQLRQGSCDTYAVVDHDTSDFTRGLQGNGTNFGGTSGFLRPHIHAGKFRKLSKATLKALGASEYLFARKVDGTTQYEDGTSLVEAFDKFIFSRH